MNWEEINEIETRLKDALAFYESSPDHQYDDVAVLCIAYTMTMKPWLGGSWTLPSPTAVDEANAAPQANHTDARQNAGGKGVLPSPTPAVAAQRAKPMREWLVIEDSRKHGVFAPEEAKTPTGFIPRDVAERILGRRMDANQWFTREESELMRAQPEWTTNLDVLDNHICKNK